MIQLRYRVSKSFGLTLPLVRLIRSRWIDGLSTFGVEVEAIDWKRGGSQGAIRRRLMDRKTLPNGKVGIVARYASPEWSLCDYDRPASPALLAVWRLARRLGVNVRVIEYRRTRRGWHVSVQWSRSFRPIELIAIQAILGSDPFRESFNLARVLGGRASQSNRWNLLFKEKLK